MFEILKNSLIGATGVTLKPRIIYTSVYYVLQSQKIATGYTMCLKKVFTFKLSVTLLKLNRFSNFLHCWKAYEICYKTVRHTYLTLGMFLHYLGKLKIHIFSRYSADVHFIASKFVIQPQILIFSVFKITSFPNRPSQQGGAHGGTALAKIVRAPAKITGLFMLKNQKRPNGNHVCVPWRLEQTAESHSFLSRLSRA